jgi:hypothetical protein
MDCVWTERADRVQIIFFFLSHFLIFSSHFYHFQKILYPRHSTKLQSQRYGLILVITAHKGYYISIVCCFPFLLQIYKTDVKLEEIVLEKKKREMEKVHTHFLLYREGGGHRLTRWDGDSPYFQWCLHMLFKLKKKRLWRLGRQSNLNWKEEMII